MIHSNKQQAVQKITSHEMLGQMLENLIHKKKSSGAIKNVEMRKDNMKIE